MHVLEGMPFLIDVGFTVRVCSINDLEQQHHGGGIPFLLAEVFPNFTAHAPCWKRGSGYV